jgi:3-oxoacyl-[acyl-carrier-protein] synthase-3
VLLIGADKMSSATNWYDRQTCIILADGAFACVLEATEEKDDWFKPERFFFGTDGSLADRIMTKKGGSVDPLEYDDLANPLKRQDKIDMLGNLVFKEITRMLVKKVIPRVLERSKLTLDQIKLMIFHQANLRMIEKVVEDLHFKGQVYNNIQWYGNTTSASIGLALYEAWQKGMVNHGDLVMLVAFGGGYTWGVVIIRWRGLNTLDIPLTEEGE